LNPANFRHLLCRHEGVLHGSRLVVLQESMVSYRDPLNLPDSTIRRRTGARILEGFGRARYVGITDDEALDGFQQLCGRKIIPALDRAMRSLCASARG